jgi:hypothetical protein
MIIQRQQSQIESLAPLKKRRKVTVDSNERFANIVNIKQAIDVAAAAEAKQSRRDLDTIVRITSETVQGSTIEAIQFEWQI